MNDVGLRLQSLAPRLREEALAQHEARARARQVFSSLNPATLDDKLRRSGKGLIFRVPQLPNDPSGRCPIPSPPGEYLVIAADGSAITIDRHSPIPSFLINIGSVQLRYGREPDFRSTSKATVHATAPELSLVDPADGVSILPIDDQFVEIEQAIQELEQIATLVAEAPADLPVVALVDGPLVVWGLADSRRQGYIRAGNIVQRYEAALAAVARVAAGRLVGFAGYISFPGTDNVANLVRLAHCPYQVADCSAHCSGRLPIRSRDCDEVGTIDRNLFWDHLNPGERSAIFGALSDPVAISFCYVHTGEEIARVEIPGWVTADSERLDLTMAVIMDQIRRGLGYPVALMEADAQAVVGTADRSWFQRQIVDLLDGARLPSDGSAKARSKRVRGV